MTKTISIICRGAVVAAALAIAPIAFAGPSAGSPGMNKALDKAAQGPDELRWFVQRTRMIYALNFDEVMDLYEALKAANATPPAVIVTAPPR